MKDVNKPIAFYFFYLIAFLSGFAFLIFEVSWFRMLSLVVGSTSAASAIVLSAYLSGLGVGAFYFGKKQSQFPLWFLYVIIALVAFASYFVVKTVIPDFYPWMATFSPKLVNLTGYLIAVFTLFVPAFFMGGVFPLIAIRMQLAKENKNSILAKLYAFETIGSVIGGLIAGFVLIKIFGQFYTILLATTVLLLLAVFALVSKLNKSKIASSKISGDEVVQKIIRSKDYSNSWQIAVIATFVCGFGVVSMQTIWFRFFKVYFVNTSYTFAIISSMVILGLYLGSWFYSIVENKIKNISKTLFYALVWMAITAIIGVFIVVNLPSMVIIPLAVLQDDYLTRIVFIPLLTALLVIIPLSAISGFCLPLIWSLVAKSGADIGESTGKILFANSMGSVAGPLLATFVFIPFFGSALSAVFPILLIIIAALWVAKKSIFPNKKWQMNLFIALFSVFALTLVVLKPTVRILPPSFDKYEKQIIAYGETVEGTYVVGKENDANNPVISTYVNNSSVIGSTYDAIKAVKMVGHIPFLMGLECKKALIVGFGIGVTTSAIASHPKVEEIDCVELIPELQKVAHYYGEVNREVYNDPRLKMHGGDGRHFLQTSNKKYDLISSDPTHPILGSGNIYTQEYFQLCKSHLTENGMISQYMPLHKLRLSDFLGVIKTFYSVFEDATVWIGQYHAILIGSKRGNSIPIDFQTWQKEALNLPNDSYFYNNPYHLASCLLLNSAQIEDLTANSTINSDDKSYVEFFSFDAFESSNLPNNLIYLNQHRGGVSSAFVNVENPALFSKFIYGNQLLTEGVIEMLKGNNPGYKGALQKAIKENPDNQEFPFLLKLLF